MKIAVLYVTKGGEKTACRIKESLDGVKIFGKDAFETGLSQFVKEAFSQFDTLIFIMSAGIAVRMIAPLLKNKFSDPAVLVLDEEGRYVISLLSGHVGGANALAKEVAAITNGQTVITTASDTKGMIAIDVFAKEKEMEISNPKELKHISGAMVNGEQVGLFYDGVECIHIPPYFTPQKAQRNNIWISNGAETPLLGEHTLHLLPKNLVLGMGCKKATPKEKLENAVEDFLKRNQKNPKSIKFISTIDIKMNELGILQLCKDNHFRLKYLSQEELAKVEKEFSYSSFVKKTVGVGNVCEACAVYAADNTKLICGKTKYEGITLALGEIKQCFSFES